MGSRLSLTIAVVVGIAAVRALASVIVRGVKRRHPHSRVAFWGDQAASLSALVFFLVACLSIWVDDPARLTSVAGIATAGVAIAAQKAVTSFAGYLVIMRGKTFTIGDRIKMGGVRGDVIWLGFLQTRISRKILAEVDAAGIAIASTSMEVTMMNDHE